MTTSLHINSHTTEAEIYDLDENIFSPTLQVRKNTSVGASVFPNPWRDETSLFLNLKEDGNVMLELFDLNGRVVYAKESFYPKGTLTLKLHSADLQSNGIFIYSITTETEKFVGKMCKEE